MFENAESHRFGEKWNGRLDESRIYSLHMKDAMRLGGEFRGWNEPDSDHLLRELAKLAAQRLRLKRLTGEMFWVK